MPRTPKSSKGSGFGKKKSGGKKTSAEKHDQEMGRFWRSVIEKQVRTQMPRANEQQIKAEINALRA